MKGERMLGGGVWGILEDRVEGGLGGGRHLHNRGDEVLRLVEGRSAVWIAGRCLTVTPGDLIFLPKGVEHAWRAYGEQSVRMNVTISPGGFEHFFPTIQARGLAAHNVEELTAVCDEFGINVSGPPLSDEEIESLVAQR